ncbi:hypothetical protein DMH15_29545 [Streptomyces sp. WAC 06725]|uniref:NUDIX domain-containing protein n=1 Tax=Streptomyces sp. WAC 06725 TaxID=2203209 RepID=UPI000F73CAC1|nr:NUDIX hydrolase [Streptomyces sp. WAC 06725]RSO26419.1 hypothetical protein DMH15_29545 [Streptomyces sp. WAC 06725]
MHNDINRKNPPPVRVGCQSLVRLESGDVLAVRTTYGDCRYQLPGGHRHDGERIKTAGDRELYEETGLTLPRGNLLVVDEIDERPGVHTAGINFVYDYGVCNDPDSIRLPASPGTGEAPELDRYLWLAEDLLDEHCADYMAKRIHWSLYALAENTTVSLVRGELADPERRR